MKSPLLLVSAVLVIFLLPATLLSINEFRSVDYGPEPHIIDTAVGVTEADIILSQDLLSGRTANVTLASNNTDDAPIPSIYVAATHTLTIIGLNPDDTRTMQVTYKIGALGDYWGADVGTRVWPMLIIVGIFGLMAGAVYNATRRGE